MSDWSRLGEPTRVEVATNEWWCKPGEMYILANVSPLEIAFDFGDPILKADEPHKVIFCHPDDEEKVRAVVDAADELELIR